MTSDDVRMTYGGVDDIIEAVPWRDETGIWHLANYWAYADGTFSVDAYQDGDHEDIAPGDVPTYPAIDTAWIDYATHVIQTGDDPLWEYGGIRRTITRRERWQFRFAPSIIGPVLVRARRAGREYAARELPAHVREWLTLADDYHARRLTWFDTWDELVAVEPGIKPHVWFTARIDHEEPRAPSAIERDVRARARAHLRRLLP